MKVQVKSPEAVAKRMCWLAWQACGGPLGMGVYQDRPDADEEAVWNNVAHRGDYPGKHNPVPGKASADYVFGRMMKLYLQWDGESITISDSVPTVDYQSWCRKYRTYQELVDAAVKSLA